MSSLTTFWTEAYRWPVEKPGFVFLARAMNRVGKALYPTQWTGSEPWAEKVLPPLPESPGIDARIELTKDVERAYRLLGKELPPPVYARIAPSLNDTTSPDFGTGLLGQPPFAGTLGQGSREKRAAVAGVTPLPQLVLSPAPALSDEEWAEARRRSIEIVNASAAQYERWSQVMVFTWRAFVTGTLECFLRNDDTGKYEGPTDADWWNFEGYVSRFGLCQMDKGRPTKQRHFERGHNIRSTEFVGSDFRLIFVSETSLDAALSNAKSLELEQPAAVVAVGERPKLSLRRKPEFLAFVKKAVTDSPDDYPEGWSRDLYIAHGHDEMHLPMGESKATYAEALRLAVQDGVDHQWSKRKPKAR